MATAKGDGAPDDKKKRRALGEGGVFWSESRQCFIAQVDLGYVDGKRKRKQRTGFKTEREAAKAVREMQAEVEAGLDAKSDKMTVGDLFEEWYDTNVKGVRSASTQKVYEIYIRLHLGGLKKHKLRDVTPGQLQRFVNGLKKKTSTRNGWGDKTLSYETVRAITNLLRACFAKAEEWHYISESPAEHLEIPKKESFDQEPFEADPYTLEEAMQLLRFVWGKEDEPLIFFGLLYGYRINETLGTQLKHINEKEATVRVPGTKTEDSRGKLPLIPLLAQRLPHWIREDFTPDSYLIPSENGGRMNPNAARKRYYKLLEEAGLRRVRYHDLRHSCGTLLTEMDVPLPIVAKILRHTQVRTTQRYTKARDAAVEKALTRFTHLLGFSPEGDEIGGFPGQNPKSGLSNGLSSPKKGPNHTSDDL